MVASTYPRTFVPPNTDPADWSQLQPLYQSLLDRPIGSPQELERWLLDLSELYCVVDEYGARRYIDKSCHTDDNAIEARFMQFVEQIEPNIKPVFFQLQKKYLASPYRMQLNRARFQILDRKWAAEADIFREENVPLQTEETKLTTEFDKICGDMQVDYDGRQQTLQQLARYQEEPDRAVRQQAWELASNRRLVDRQPLTAVFEKLLTLRETIAKNARLSDYRAFCWKAYKRFDYTPEQCLQFADAIATACVPVVDELDRHRAADLKLDRLRPWDTGVDPLSRPALKPFRQDQISLFVEKTREIFERMSPELGDDFDSLRRNNNLDLESRKGKRPGGYQCSLHETRQPFIFMNAVGVQRDVETLLHEGGHAFHLLASRGEDLSFLRDAPMEFCEVASMSMELLGADHFELFYSDADANRARRALFEGIIRFFPWMATIDSFQHWLYTHPGHSESERTAFWLSLLDRFGSKLDWTGHEQARAAGWQKQTHLFHVPFYYIEYGIAQLGALQLWMKSRHDPQRALANYRHALSLGGTRSLPELFNAAGIEFDFSAKTLVPLMVAVRDELGALPR